MWVKPEYRRFGVGNALLAQSIAWAGSIGATEVRLGVTLVDSLAYRLYLRHGFVPMSAPEPLREGVSLLAQSMSLTLGGKAWHLAAGD